MTGVNPLLAVSLAGVLGQAALAQTPRFTPGHLAVLQEGDGGTNRGFYAASDINGSRQNQIFIDQFDPRGINQTNPTYRVAIPTNGPTAMLINGNAGTEGVLTLSGDRSVLAFAAYQGDILSIATGQSTAPSNLSYDRGIGTVDAFGSYSNVYRGGAWYGIATGKTNPRGVATDGAGDFWGCGNGYGSLYYNANSGSDPIQFQNIALTSFTRVINDTLYASVKNSESVNLYPAGIYSFVDFWGNPDPYPNAASFLQLVVPAATRYNTCIGFDINPQGNVAYVTDTTYGIQKYIKPGLNWSLAYNLAIPGYTNRACGTMTNAGSTEVLVGCFSVTVDWTGSNPVVYATTADSGWNSGSPYYGNRVIRINDTNTTTSGLSLIATTNILTTVAKPPGEGLLQLTNVVYKSVTFTPDLRPAITTNPMSWSAAVGDTASFQVGAESKYALNYQWLRNGFALNGKTGSTLALNFVVLGDDHSSYQCVVSNAYGAATSTVATLTVSVAPVAPSLPVVQNVTNFVGNNLNLSVSAAGTDPISYQWYFNGNALSDVNQYSGTATPTLSIATAQTSDSGVYSVVAMNAAGAANAASNVVVNLTVQYAPPVLVQLPVSATTYVGRDATFTAIAYGSSLTYQWWAATVLSTNVTVSTNIVKTIYTNSVLASTTTNSSSAGTNFGSFGTLLNLVGSDSVLVVSNPQVTDATVTTTNLSLLITNPAVFTGITNGTFVTNSVATTITNTTVMLGTNRYYVVFTTPGGALTNGPVSLNVQTAPPHTFIAYTNLGQSYFQDFNSLPIPGGGSAEGLNPVHITYVMTNIAAMLTNNNYANANMASELQYSIDSPMDFGYPILASGGIGGLGLSNKMNGWYGWAHTALVFAATKGDQSQGALVDNGGNYYADGTPLTGITNRALGLIATTKSGAVAFGAAFINQSTNTFKKINLSYTGELWRNNPNAQPLQFGYEVDPAGTSSTLNPDTMLLTLDPSLDVTFPTTDSTLIFDGTQSSNQMSRSVTGYALQQDWTPGSALWLVWQATTLGSAQNLALDNLSLSAFGPAAVLSQSAANLTAGSATLKATVNTDGASTAYYFEYGTTASYGSVTATNSLAAGLGTPSVSLPLTGLLQGTTYHFRTVVRNSEGAAYGSDASFSTLTVTAPRLTSAHILGTGALQFSFTNVPAASFTVLTSTNVTLPLSSWQVLGHPIESPAGQYQFTSPQPATNRQLFYELRQP